MHVGIAAETSGTAAATASSPERSRRALTTQSSDRCVPGDAVLMDATLHHSARAQTVQMGDTLARCHDRVALGDPAAEKHPKAIDSAFRLRAQRSDLGKTGFMLVDQFGEPDTHAAERLIVRRKNKNVGRQE